MGRTQAPLPSEALSGHRHASVLPGCGCGKSMFCKDERLCSGTRSGPVFLLTPEQLFEAILPLETPLGVQRALLPSGA